MTTISTQELKGKIDKGDKFHLVDVLAPESFAERRIPGAVNVPNGLDFADEIERVIAPSKEDEIVLYCASADCMASESAARKLEEAGYENVKHYKDGLAGWERAGHRFESGE